MILTPTAAAPTPASQAGRSALKLAGLAAAAYVAFNLLLPLVPPLPIPLLRLLALPSTMAFMLLQLWLAQSVVNLRLRPLVCVLMALLFTGLVVATIAFIRPHSGWPGAVNASLFVLTPLLQGLGLTLGCAFLSILLSRIVREPNVLLPVALVAMPIDYLGAMTSIGFTQNVVAHHPEIVRQISIPVPGIGPAAHPGALHPIGFIGPGDALFVAFFFAVVLRLDMNVRGTFWWIYGLLTATMLFVLSPWGFNIAALVPMGLAVLFANFKYFKLKREEVFATLYAGLLIVALVTGFYFYAHSRFAKSDAEGTPNAKPAAASSNPASPSPAPGRPAAN